MHLIMRPSAKYFGDPIEVHATFEVVKEDLEETKDTTLRGWFSSEILFTWLSTLLQILCKLEIIFSAFF